MKLEPVWWNYLTSTRSLRWPEVVSKQGAAVLISSGWPVATVGGEKKSRNTRQKEQNKEKRQQQKSSHKKKEFKERINNKPNKWLRLQ